MNYANLFSILIQIVAFNKSFLYFPFWKATPVKTEIPGVYSFWRASCENMQNFLFLHIKTSLASNTRTICSSECRTH